VLEGRYVYEVDGQRMEVGEGDMVSVPGGAAHAFVNITDKPAQQRVLMLPAMDALNVLGGRGEWSSLGLRFRLADCYSAVIMPPTGMLVGCCLVRFEVFGQNQQALFAGLYTPIS
jgi:hypothetical protein